MSVDLNAPITKEELLELYKEMRLIRMVEQLAAKAYTLKKILGFCHLYIGQESVAVGAAASTKDDYWISAYREHGHALAKGMDANSIMAEMFGKETGCVKGLGGSMHLFDSESRFMGGWGIVGGHVPLANGVGWAIKHRKEERVCVCFFEMVRCIKVPSLKRCVLPNSTNSLLFICENNFYAMGTKLIVSRPPRTYTNVQTVLE